MAETARAIAAQNAKNKALGALERISAIQDKTDAAALGPALARAKRLLEDGKLSEAAVEISEAAKGVFNPKAKVELFRAAARVHLASGGIGGDLNASLCMHDAARWRQLENFRNEDLGRAGKEMDLAIRTARWGKHRAMEKFVEKISE